MCSNDCDIYASSLVDSFHPNALQYRCVHSNSINIMHVQAQNVGICPLTKVHNKLCEVDESKPLITFLNRIVPNYPNNTKNVIMLYYVILTIIISYDIISIIKKYLIK